MQQTWVPPGRQASLYHLGADPRSLLLSAASSQSCEAGTLRRLNELRGAEGPPEAQAGRWNAVLPFQPQDWWSMCCCGGQPVGA